VHVGAEPVLTNALNLWETKRFGDRLDRMLT